MKRKHASFFLFFLCAFHSVQPLTHDTQDLVVLFLFLFVSFRFLPFFLLIETRASYSVHYRFNERKKEARRKKQTEGNVMVVLFFAFFHSPLPFYNGMEMKREKGKGKNEKKESTKHKGHLSSGSFSSLLSFF